jgi:hypothetical protein
VYQPGGRVFVLTPKCANRKERTDLESTTTVFHTDIRSAAGYCPATLELQSRYSDLLMAHASTEVNECRRSE